jgi:putative ABC transport system permease protein
MIKNYFKIAVRTLIRNKSFTLINITGLAVGISACLLIFLIVQFELSFDNFHANKDRIYRIVSEMKSPSGMNYSGGIPFPVADALRNEYPELKKVTDIYLSDDAQIIVLNNNKNYEKKFKEENGVFFVDPQFFDIFNFKWLIGSSIVLSNPANVVLTQGTAEKYFGNWKSAIGKSIRYNNKYTYNVAGIIKNVPANTDFPLKVLMSFQSFKNDNKENFNDWVSVFGNNYCFVLFPENLSVLKFDSFLKDFVKRHKPPEYTKDNLAVQPLDEMHFDSRFGNYSNRTFSRELIAAISLIALFLLIIACVNFINIAAAQAISRSHEVGVRKVLGSTRKQLSYQFFSEIFILTLIAVSVSIVISEIILPFLNNLLQVKLNINFLTNPSIILFLAALIFLVTLSSGFYPAIILSGFNPVSVFRGKALLKNSSGVSLRRSLVVFQFIIAQVLIICMLVVVSQMDFFKNSSYGFAKDHVVVVPVPRDSISLLKTVALKNQLLQQSGVKDVSLSTFTPVDNTHWHSDFKFNNSDETTDFNADLKWADNNYFKFYNLKFIAGRSYANSDTIREFVVNETLIKKLGIKNPGDAIGKKINLWNGAHVASIVGVVKDFNDAPLVKAVNPVLMSSWREVYGLINIKIHHDNIKNTLSTIESIWNKYYPDYVYEYQFLDQKIDNFYKHEDQLSQLYKIFAVLAIFISCLGLYGLVSFMVIRKTKEVGIRKVLGASTGNIIYLFSKEFIILIGIAFLIAAPSAYYLMNQWLENFAYKIEMGAGLFLLTILCSVTVALLTVGYKAIKAAVTNPVKSLKYE